MDRTGTECYERTLPWRQPKRTEQVTEATIKTRTLDSIDQGTFEKDVEGQIRGFQVVDGEHLSIQRSRTEG